MSGTDHSKQLIKEGPAIILVEPQLGENIGMVARAMANFGLSELRIINPRDGWPNERAVSAASKADHVIEGAVVFDTTEEAVADLNFVYATTARSRDMIKTVVGPQVAAKTLRGRFNSGEKTGIMFGRERWGLNNEEITLADEIVTFPVNPAFASLNIAQAVLLMSYEWMNTRQNSDEALEDSIEDNNKELASKSELIGLFDHMEQALDDAKYFYPADKREKMVQNMRNLFSDSRLKRSQIHVFRGIIAALERRWQRRQSASADEHDSK